MHALASELERVKTELNDRTTMMGIEMERWRQQADATSTAVIEAKNEVMERKKDLDSTKEKMDKLVEKLYVSRERGVELAGAIDHHLQQMHGAKYRAPVAAQHGPAQHGHTSHLQPQPPAHREPGAALPARQAPPPSVAFGGTLHPTTVRRPQQQQQQALPATLGRPKQEHFNRTRPRQVVPPQHTAAATLPPINGQPSYASPTASTSRKTANSKTLTGQKSSGDRWAESRRDAGMVAYAARWG
eukprot:jgi/Astpho2/8593/Aster-x0814